MSATKTQRVRVLDGSGTKELGFGDYVGDVEAYFVIMPDGSLRSRKDASQKPLPSEVPQGARVVKTPDNPKIIMDDGSVVFGCQVWWEPVQD